MLLQVFKAQAAEVDADQIPETSAGVLAETESLLLDIRREKGNENF